MLLLLTGWKHSQHAWCNQPLVQRQPNSPILPSSMLYYHHTVKNKTKQKQKKNKRKPSRCPMKRLRFTSYSSSYHCPISKRLDCSGWLSDWPQALAGRAGHCEGRLGNELEIGDPTIQTDCWGQKRTNKQLGSEGRGGRGVERLWKHKGQTKRVSMLERSKSKGSWCSLALMSNTAPLLLQYCDIWLWQRRFILPRGGAVEWGRSVTEPSSHTCKVPWR